MSQCCKNCPDRAQCQRCGCLKGHSNPDDEALIQTLQARLKEARAALAKAKP